MPALLACAHVCDSNIAAHRRNTLRRKPIDSLRSPPALRPGTDKIQVSFITNNQQFSTFKTPKVTQYAAPLSHPEFIHLGEGEKERKTKKQNSSDGSPSAPRGESQSSTSPVSRYRNEDGGRKLIVQVLRAWSGKLAPAAAWPDGI